MGWKRERVKLGSLEDAIKLFRAEEASYEELAKEMNDEGERGGRALEEACFYGILAGWLEELKKRREAEAWEEDIKREGAEE